MSIKFSQEEYMKKVNSIYNSPNIEWNGYCELEKRGCKKFSKELFLERLE